MRGVSKPPAAAALTWNHGLVFHAESGGVTVTTDGDSREGPSPVQLLAISIAGCMAADLAHILQKGRHPLERLRAEIVAERAQTNPHRLLRVTLRFVVNDAVPRDAVARAVELSREKYCSVWHSLREDIELAVTCDVG